MTTTIVHSIEACRVIHYFIKERAPEFIYAALSPSEA